MSSAILTVAIPVYNAMPYLPEAVESILKQSHNDFMLLLVNDGSTDGSAEFMDSIKDPRVSVIHNENKGLGATLNDIIGICSTDLLARMDADDVSCPERLSLQTDYMTKHPETVMLGTQVEFIAGTKTFAGPTTPTDHHGIQDLLLKRKAAICHASCIFRTSALHKIGGYKINRAGQDTDLFLRMCEAGQVANLDKILYRIRVHGNSTCFTDWDKINRGRAYAVNCAKLRAHGTQECEYDEFVKIWDQRGLIEKITDRIDGWSAVQYRNAMIDMGNSRQIQGMLRMLSAALCRPEAVIRRLSGRHSVK